jgi:hypothetical protein
MRITSFFLKLMFLIFLSSCSGIPDVKPVHTETGSFAFGIDLIYNQENSKIHFLRDANSYYSPTVKIMSELEDKDTFRLFFFLDFEHVEIYHKGNKKLFIDVDVQPIDEKLVDVKIESVPEGTHDFIVIAARSMDKLLNKEKFINYQEIFIYQRVQLIVGNKDDNKHNKITYKEVEVISDEILHGMYLSGKESFKSKDIYSLISIDEVQDAWLHLSSYEKDSRFALIAFSYERQLPIEYTFIQVNEIGKVSIPLSMPIVDKYKPQNIAVGLFKDPFKVEKEFAKFTNKLTVD